MKTIWFQAATAEGRVVEGKLAAEHSGDAVQELVHRGLHPMAVAEAAAPRPRVSRRDLAVLLEGLATLLRAGVPLDSALTAVPGLSAQAVAQVRAEVRGGQPLSHALESLAGVPPIVIGLVRAGESSGLAAALECAAQQVEREAELIRRVSSALAYPALLVAFGSVSVAVLLLVVLPRFVALLGDPGALPPATRALVAVGNAVGGHWLVLVLALAGIIAGLWWWLGSSAGHRTLLGIPLAGSILFRFASARASRALAAMLGVGAPALQALDAAALAVGNGELYRRIRAAAERVRVGSGLSASLTAERAMTPGTLQLLRIGEHSGKVTELLQNAARIDERDASRALDSAVRLIEPVLILLLGGLVGLVAIAMLQGIYSLRPA